MQTRINITLPSELARDLRKNIPARSRSKFISRALEEKLSQKRFSRKEWAKALEVNSEYYMKVGKEIERDFKYADAEIAKSIP